MIIKEIYIENFGKLSGFKQRFKDGLNVIVEKNKEGNVGIIEFKFDGEHQSFYEVTYDY